MALLTLIPGEQAVALPEQDISASKSAAIDTGLLARFYAMPLSRINWWYIPSAVW